MADDDRRAGDWQKRDLRKNANDLIEEPNQKAWCKQTFWIVFFLIVFWPVGIVLCWRSSWHIVILVQLVLNGSLFSLEMIAHKEHSRYALAAKGEKSHRSRSPSEKARVVPHR